jgi:ABC-type antimicrobial peptide transport system permease subunit
MGCVVAERTPEIGIRIALGARPSIVLWQLLRQGMVLALSGLGLGLMLTVVGGRIIAHYLPTGIRPFVDWMNILIAVVITAVALLACYIPARRAARVDPMEALRYE